MQAGPIHQMLVGSFFSIKGFSPGWNLQLASKTINQV